MASTSIATCYMYQRGGDPWPGINSSRYLERLITQSVMVTNAAAGKQWGTEHGDM